MRRDIRKGHQDCQIQKTAAKISDLQATKASGLALQETPCLTGATEKQNVLDASERSCRQTRGRVLSWRVRRGGCGASWAGREPWVSAAPTHLSTAHLRHSCQTRTWKANMYPLPRCNETQLRIYLSLTIIRAVFRGNHLNLQGFYFILEFHFN